MKFWIPVVVGIVAITGLCTFLFVKNPDLDKSTLVKPPEVKAPPKPSADSPKIAVTKTEEVFENLPQNYKGEAAFEIRNEGKSPLRMVAEKANCQCTEALLDAEEIAPGASTTFRMRFDTKVKLGEIPVMANVNTNDPVKPQIPFKITMKIVQELLVTTSDLNLGSLVASSTANGSFIVYSTHSDKIAPSDLRFSNKILKAKVEPVTDEERKKLGAKGAARIVVYNEGVLPVGTLADSVTFKTGNDRVPEYSVSITAAVEGDISFEPDSKVAFGNVYNDRPTEKKIRVFARGLKAGESLKLGKIDPTFVTAKLEQKGRTIYFLTVTVPTGAPTGQHKGMLEIVDQTGHARISLPISVVVAEKGTVAGT